MKRYGHLFERISAFETLLLAAHKAMQGKRDRLRVAHFMFHLEPEIFRLQDELRSGVYRMRPYRTFTIFEPKQRQICAADFRDRVVQHAICHVLDPIFERCLIHDTYACCRDKGTQAAVKRAQQFTRRLPYVLTYDIRAYFPCINHAMLKALLRRKLLVMSSMLLGACKKRRGKSYRIPLVRRYPIFSNGRKRVLSRRLYRAAPQIGRSSCR